VHDVVIVGAGSAGCVLAARLSEDPSTSVLLLEAGGPGRKLHVRIPAAFAKLYGSALDWGYSTVPQAALDGRRLVFPRGKVLGGSSATNAMMAIRGHRADHDAWPPGGAGTMSEPRTSAATPIFRAPSSAARAPSRATSWRRP
jgi:choline dehydrogenase